VLRKKLRSSYLTDTLKEWRTALFWLSLFVLVSAVAYGPKAPAMILARLFIYMLIVYLLMFMPFVTGLAGFNRAVGFSWLIAASVTLLFAGAYHLIYRESIWLNWYRGAFDRAYIEGLLRGVTIVPGISFLAGLALRTWLK
jgi:uncharacterized membrane protein